MFMLYRTPKPSVKKILTLSGRQLSSKKWTKSQRAAFAAMAVRGEVKLAGLTLAQLCGLFQVSHSYVKRALSLPAELRAGIVHGDLTIAGIPSAPTEKKLADTVRAAGVERTWDEICRQLQL
jgi:hypothetical protein